MQMVFAALIGLAAAGLTGSLWHTFAGAPPRAAMLLTRDWLLPLRVLVLVLHAPILIMRDGRRAMAASRLIGLATIGAAGVWSFFAGVFILTRFFALP